MRTTTPTSRTLLADLFDLTGVTGVTDRSGQRPRIRDTWLVGAPIAGTDVDADVDRRDVRALGLASAVETVRVHIDGSPA